MRVYSFGDENAPVIMLLPGTCCHWKGNFGHVIPLLERDFRVLCVSYDGFDETERTEFPTMLEETAKIEEYIKTHCGGRIRAAYGCSLGGARPYVTMRSCKNQFYYDLITPLPDKLDVPGTQIHIFYALKMGEKYRERYERHFAQPVIHEQDMQHEELLACHPEEWAQLVKSIIS